MNKFSHFVACVREDYVRWLIQNPGLIGFVAATSDGPMIDFEVYQGVRTEFEDKSLGIDAAVILHLTKTIPLVRFVYLDRYFTLIPLLERVDKDGFIGQKLWCQTEYPTEKTLNSKKTEKWTEVKVNSLSVEKSSL